VNVRHAKKTLAIKGNKKTFVNKLHVCLVRSYAGTNSAECAEQKGKKMNITAITSEGFISCGGMGAHVHWDRNNAKAKKDGLQSCHHCGKGMADNTAYRCFFVWQSDEIVPLNKVAEVEAQGKGEWVRVGNTCIKNFVYKNEIETYFEKVG